MAKTKKEKPELPVPYPGFLVETDKHDPEFDGDASAWDCAEALMGWYENVGVGCDMVFHSLDDQRRYQVIVRERPNWDAI